MKIVKSKIKKKRCLENSATQTGRPGQQYCVETENDVTGHPVQRQGSKKRIMEPKRQNMQTIEVLGRKQASEPPEGVKPHPLVQGPGLWEHAPAHSATATVSYGILSTYSRSEALMQQSGQGARIVRVISGKGDWAPKK